MHVHRTLWFGTTKISGLLCEAQCVWGSLELTYYYQVDELGWRLQGCIAQKEPNPLGPYSMHVHRTLRCGTTKISGLICEAHCVWGFARVDLLFSS